MFKNFSVTEIFTDLYKKEIAVHFSFDLLSTTIHSKSIKLVNNTDGSVIPLKYSINKSCILLTLVEDPVPDAEYILFINKEVQSITGTFLQTQYIRHIVFKSKFKQTVDIVKPANLEEVTIPKIVWKENYVEEPVLRYRLQISDTNEFFNLLVNTLITDQQEIIISNLIEPNQYFVRVRVEREKEYGVWSDIISFVLNTRPQKEEYQKKVDARPVFFKPLKITTTPTIDTDNNSFIIEFDSMIDPTKITENSISIYRKDW